MNPGWQLTQWKRAPAKVVLIWLMLGLKIEDYPLPEQRAIVAKIEELFSELDKGEEDLKKPKSSSRFIGKRFEKGFEGEWKKLSLGDLEPGDQGTPSRANLTTLRAAYLGWKQAN